MNFITIPWTPILLAGLTAAVVTWLATPLIVRTATAVGWLDIPGGRHIHPKPIPRVGGIAIWFGVILSLLVYFGFDPRLYGIFLGGTAFFALGLLDDIYNLSPPLKLLGQIAAAAIAIVFGITISNLTNPLGGTLLLSPIWDVALTLFWILLVVNTVNFLDGLDGLAAGVSSIAAIALLVLSLLSIVNQPNTAVWAAIVAGGAIGFLVYNWHPARIFMGDAGSHFLGFMVASLAIISGGKVATAALVLGLPIMDLIWAVVRRLRQGRSPWSADREHLHHLLFDLGLGQRTVVGLLYLLAIGFGAVALVIGTKAKLLTLGVVVLAMMGIIRLVLYFKRRYFPLDRS